MPGVYLSPIISNTGLSDDLFLLELRAPVIAENARPGNFVQLKIDLPSGILWRRPFSILDIQENRISILYKILGKGTRALSTFESGREMSVIGPLGNHFQFPAKGRIVMLAGGGIGIPPLYFLLKRLMASGYDPRKIHFFNGAYDAGCLVYIEQCAEPGINVYAVTEDGSLGIKGLITDGMRQYLGSKADTAESDDIVIYACGPMPMMRAVAGLADEYGINCQLALEALMPCGFGVCMGCAVKVRDDNGGSVIRRVCREGPVFDARDIIWE
jgi:dihydroorotate dehydrogenase electron transfer subunit